jgi:ubiquinone biosynthesis protein
VIGFGRKIRHLQRYRDIVKAFACNGFGFIVRDLGLADVISRADWSEKHDARSRSIGERLRMFLEELGPTFVKIGQIASTRPDLLPASIIGELVHLQDRVVPFPFEQARDVIEEQFGEPLGKLFPEFDETPMAAASIGQVHLARLHTGEAVAVKIQRPDIRAIVETDLEIMENLASLAERRLDWAARIRLRDIVYELAESLRAELDFTIEGRNAERIGKQSASDPEVRIPKIYWDYTNRHVLTMEYLDGVKLTDANRLDELGFDRKKIAERIVGIVFRQIFDNGFFHADPHPGNIIALSDGTIGLIDFGMVGRLSPTMKYHFGSLVIALRRNNVDGIVRAIDAMGVIPEGIDMRALRADLNKLRDKYYDVPLSRIRLGEAVNDLFAVAYEHKIDIPPDLTMLGKALLTLEGVVTSLDPAFSIVDVAEPFGRKLLVERLDPRHLTEALWQKALEYADLAKEMPAMLRELSGLLKQGRLRIDIALPELDAFVKKIVRTSNRLSFSIVLLAFSIVMAGLIIGSSIGRQATPLWNFPVIEIGFAIAAVMLLWLLYSIFRSGRF